MGSHAADRTLLNCPCNLLNSFSGFRFSRSLAASRSMIPPSAYRQRSAIVRQVRSFTNVMRSLGSRFFVFQGVAGRSSIGFLGKKSNGRRMNSCHMTGMTGQSSARGAWWKPSVYQATISVFSMGRLALVQMAKPSSAPLLSVAVWSGGSQPFQPQKLCLTEHAARLGRVRNDLFLANCRRRRAALGAAHCKNNVLIRWSARDFVKSRGEKGRVKVSPHQRNDAGQVYDDWSINNNIL